MKVIKRDGREADFDPSKIDNAVTLCCKNGVGLSEDESKEIGSDIASAVTNILQQQKEHPISVEGIQQLVIQQLWASNLFNVAEKYTIYREEHRKIREEQEEIDPEVQRRIDEDSKHFPTQIQYYQFISKFARWREEDKRRETWEEACTRVIQFFKKQTFASIVTPSEWFDLYSALYNMEVMCSMRCLQMAGPALDRCNVGGFNCAFLPLSDIQAFAEHLYILMQGTGSGFSVEDEYISKLPKIKPQKTGKKAALRKFIIEDSTEAWCDALKFGMETWFDGYDVEFDYSPIRPAGARLKTKGGRSSGPEPLKNLLTFTRNKVLANQGSRLKDIDAHDIACMIGKIVQVGGVRRASCISLSDLHSMPMREAKYGDWTAHKHRSMSNNSACYEEEPDDIEFMEEWLSLAKSGSGERGIFNRFAINHSLPQRRKRVPRFGCNPCGEILLRPYEFCNLSIAVARPNDTIESLERKVKLATYWGILQSQLTNFKYLRPEWKKNCDEERLLGVDIIGSCDCKLLQPVPLSTFKTNIDDSIVRANRLSSLRCNAVYTAEALAKRFGISNPAAVTCIKPGGDSSILLDASSNIEGRPSEYQFRLVRESKLTPVAKLLVDEGIPHVIDPDDESVLIFFFPKKAPEGSMLTNSLTAIQRLENWLDWKLNWAEHNVSITVDVDSDEWLKTGHWVKEHFSNVTGVSFYPKEGAVYAYPPNKPITKEEYEKAVKEFPNIRWHKLGRYEKEDMTEGHRQYACDGNKCELQ